MAQFFLTASFSGWNFYNIYLTLSSLLSLLSQQEERQTILFNQSSKFLPIRLLSVIAKVSNPIPTANVVSFHFYYYQIIVARRTTFIYSSLTCLRRLFEANVMSIFDSTLPLKEVSGLSGLFKIGRFCSPMNSFKRIPLLSVALSNHSSDLTFESIVMSTFSPCKLLKILSILPRNPSRGNEYWQYVYNYDNLVSCHNLEAHNVFTFISNVY